MTIIELLKLINTAADTFSIDKLEQLKNRVSDLMMPDEDKEVLLETINLALRYVYLDAAQDDE